MLKARHPWLHRAIDTNQELLTSTVLIFLPLMLASCFSAFCFPATLLIASSLAHHATQVSSYD